MGSRGNGDRSGTGLSSVLEADSWCGHTNRTKSTVRIMKEIIYNKLLLEH